MSALYAESSAVLRWLLGADDGAAIREILASAEIVVSSALTSVEVGRTLQRLVAGGAIKPQARDSAWARFSAAAAHWHLYAVSDTVLERAAQRFPQEPVRTLDAIHLATAALFSLQVAPPVVLSVDRQVRDNAEALGLGVALTQT